MLTFIAILFLSHENEHTVKTTFGCIISLSLQINPSQPSMVCCCCILNSCQSGPSFPFCPNISEFFLCHLLLEIQWAFRRKLPSSVMECSLYVLYHLILMDSPSGSVLRREVWEEFWSSSPLWVRLSSVLWRVRMSTETCSTKIWTISLVFNLCLLFYC